jgi:hypothetical protein
MQMLLANSAVYLQIVRTLMVLLKHEAGKAQFDAVKAGGAVYIDDVLDEVEGRLKHWL